MADWNGPVAADDTDDVLDNLKLRDVDALTLCLADPTNKPTGAIRWNRGTLLFQEWDGAAWQNLGTTLGTMSAQNSNNVTITGGTIGTSVNIDAARLTSGQTPLARLGSGTPSTWNILYGDGVWREFDIGKVTLWLTATAPSDSLILNGQAVSRTTYASLFTLWGTTFGAGNGTTTFNVADLRGFFPFGKSASGTGSTLNATFGSIDHQHTYTDVVNHTHPISYATIGGPDTVIVGGTTQTADSSQSTGNPSGGVATGTTSAINPPGYAVNFIVKAL